MKKLSFGALRTLYEDLYLQSPEDYFDLEDCGDYGHKDKINECLRQFFGYINNVYMLKADIVNNQSLVDAQFPDLYKAHEEILEWLSSITKCIETMNRSAYNHWENVWDKDIINKARKQLKDELENNVVPADYAEAYTAEYWLLCAKAGIYEPLNIER